MPETAKSPAYNDSDNVLLWKAMFNFWVISGQYGFNTPKPTLGSSDTVLLSRGLEAVLALN